MYDKYTYACMYVCMAARTNPVITSQYPSIRNDYFMQNTLPHHTRILNAFCICMFMVIHIHTRVHTKATGDEKRSNIKIKIGGIALDFYMKCNEFIWSKEEKCFKRLAHKNRTVSTELNSERERANERRNQTKMVRHLQYKDQNRILAHSQTVCIFIYIWKKFLDENGKL